MNVNEGDTNKIEEVYLYIVKNASSNGNFGKVLFNKILYFSDFDFYERSHRSITGDSYVRAPHGPMASSFEETICKLKDKGYIKERHIALKNHHVQKRYALLKEFESNLLSRKEREELDRNNRRLWGMTASQVSEYSHQDMPFKATKEGETIDYDLVFYRNPVYSVLDSEAETIEESS